MAHLVDEAVKLSSQGRFTDVVTMFGGVSHSDLSAKGAIVYASALLAIGAAKDAFDVASVVSRQDSSFASALLIQAKALLFDQRYDESLEILEDMALVRKAAYPSPPEPYQISAHYALHNLEQLTYLVKHGEMSAPVPGFHRDSDILQSHLRKMISNNQGEPPWISVSGQDAEMLGKLPFRRVSEMSDLHGLSPRSDYEDLDEALSTSEPKVLVLDDFLHSVALDNLIKFCLGSTIWRHPYKFGYVGAFPEDGFFNKQLFKIISDFERAFPKSLGNAKLSQWWGFAYDSDLPGTDIHGDDADITLNLWITPNEANLDSNSGGLGIWNKTAPDHWSFDEYNSGGRTARDYLDKASASKRVVPYTNNRAVIFNGRLFHETAPASFKTGFENRRRNLTILFKNTQGRSS